jgi:hypothetical protein
VRRGIRERERETTSEMDDAGFSSLQSAMRHQQMAAKCSPSTHDWSSTGTVLSIIVFNVIFVN